MAQGIVVYATAFEGPNVGGFEWRWTYAEAVEVQEAWESDPDYLDDTIRPVNRITIPIDVGTELDLTIGEHIYREVEDYFFG